MKKNVSVLLLTTVMCISSVPLYAANFSHYGDAPQVTFAFDNEELIDIVNYIAAQKGVNIVMPMGANAITAKVTLRIDRPMSVEKAWDMLLKVLDIAGYSLLHTKNSMYTIVKNSKTITKEVIPLYIGSNPDTLPDTDERIRFLYYLTNIKVPEPGKEQGNEVATVLKEFLPAETTSVQFDAKVNALLVTDKASNIKATMQIIAALDQTTFQEQLDIIKLRYTNADTISKLFAENILKIGTEAARYKLRGKKGESTYFSEQIKIIPEPRTNKLIILGKAQAVNRVKEFIYKYIDVELETGKSILHVYQLLYLDAASFAPVLESIVKGSAQEGTGQSAAAGKATGIDRFFEGVIVKADQPKPGGGKGEPNLGSNKLIIAAKSDDWIHIKRLIEQLDKPQPLVIIEVLIADLSLDDLRQLGNSFRIPAAIPTPNPGVNMQAAEVGPVVVNPAPAGGVIAPPNGTVGGDLLARTIQSNAGLVSLAELTGENDPAFFGSTLISFNDKNGQTWSISQLLQLFSHTKILSHPHIITTNNKPATVSIGSQRLVQGETVTTAAAPTIKNDLIDANLKVTISPRISSSGIVNLQVTVNVTEFQALSNNTRITRVVTTNANVKNEDILALGGLIKTTSEDAINQTPILGNVPILGWLFKKRKNRNRKTNLTVFISPTVVQPRLRGGVGEYTKEYIGLAQTYASEATLFDSLRDPITRFFFRSAKEEASDTAINNFLAKDELKQDIMTAPATVPEGREHDNIKPQRQHRNVPPDTQEQKSIGQTLAQQDQINIMAPSESIALAQAAPQNDEELKALLRGMQNPFLNAEHCTH